MRQLSFEGYLKNLLKKHSSTDSVSIFKLTHECENGNSRIKEALCLYAIESGKADILLRAVKSPELYKEYSSVISKSVNPSSYRKVYETYKSIYCTSEIENEQKSNLRAKIISWQKSKGISNYRIYTDLHLNPGNINFWLRNGDSSKISLSTASQILRYVQNKK